MYNVTVVREYRDGRVVKDEFNTKTIFMNIRSEIDERTNDLYLSDSKNIKKEIISYTPI